MAMAFDFISKILFPTPSASYDIDSFPEELIWVPKSLDPKNASPEDCVPCLFLRYSTARFLVYYVHSNAEDLGRCHAFCTSIRAQFQVHVLAVEYPGYGVAPGGQCDEHSATENTLAGFRFIHETLKWPLDSIIILGRSIGCGPAITIASKYTIAGVVVISPMLSVKEVCKEIVGPLSFAIVERFPNKDLVASISSPFLVVHGQRDAIIPCRHGIELYKSCKSRKLLVCPEDMEHNTNLLSNITYLVLPMLQFFPLPDYCFDEMHVPSWVYDKRMCPSYNDQVNQMASSLQPILEDGMLRENSVAEPTIGCWSLDTKSSRNAPFHGKMMTTFVQPLFGPRVTRSAPASPMMARRSIEDPGDDSQAMSPNRPCPQPTLSMHLGPSVMASKPCPPNKDAEASLVTKRAPRLSMDENNTTPRGQNSIPKADKKMEPPLLQRSIGVVPIMRSGPASQNRFGAPHAVRGSASMQVKKPTIGVTQPRHRENTQGSNGSVVGPIVERPGSSQATEDLSITQYASGKRSEDGKREPVLGVSLMPATPRRISEDAIRGGRTNGDAFLRASGFEGIVRDLEKHLSSEAPILTPQVPVTSPISTATISRDGANAGFLTTGKLTGKINPRVPGKFMNPTEQNGLVPDLSANSRNGSYAGAAPASPREGQMQAVEHEVKSARRAGRPLSARHGYNEDMGQSLASARGTRSLIPLRPLEWL